MFETIANLSSSTSSVAIDAATDLQTQLPEDVPSLTPDPDQEEAQRWEDAITNCAGRAQSYGDKTHEATQQAIVMVTMDVQLHTANFYEVKLKELKLGIPKNKDAVTLAIAYYFRLDVANADKKKATNASKALNRRADAVKRLGKIAKDQIGHQNGKVKFQYDADGVKAMLSIVKAQGGINALAQALNDDDLVSDVIALSPEILSLRQSEMLKKRLEETGENIVFGIGATAGAGQVKISQPLELPAEALAVLYQHLKLADERIRFLAELFQIGEAVIEEPTDILVNADIDDPNDPNAKRRLASRQYVFHPGGQITISPILSRSSVVVLVEPKYDLLGQPILGHVRFHTFGRRRAAANISKASRQAAFDCELTGPGTTEGVGRIKLTCPAARDEKDRSKDVGMLIEHVRSTPENYPLVIADSFKPKLSIPAVPGLLRQMQEVCKAGPTLIKAGLPVFFRAQDGQISISGYTKSEAAKALGTNGSDRLNIRADDFVAVTTALANVERVSEIGILFDAGMVAFTVETAFARYEIHVPAALDKLVRSDRHLVTLTPTSWPVAESTDAAIDVSASNGNDQDAEAPLNA